MFRVGPLGNGADPIDGGPGSIRSITCKRTNSTVVYLGLISTFNDGADTNGDGLTNEFDDVFNTTENVMTGSGKTSSRPTSPTTVPTTRSSTTPVTTASRVALGTTQFQQGTAPQGADVMIGNTGSDWANYGADSSPVVGPAQNGRTDACRARSTGSTTTVTSRPTKVTSRRVQRELPPRHHRRLPADHDHRFFDQFLDTTSPSPTPRFQGLHPPASSGSSNGPDRAQQGIIGAVRVPRVSRSVGITRR